MFDVAIELFSPVVESADHARTARDVLPRTRSDTLGVGATQRRGLGEGQHTLTIETLGSRGIVEGGQIEQPAEQPTHHRVGEATMIGTRGGHTGRLELFSKRARIWIFDRMKYGDAIERLTRLGETKNFAQNRPNLFIAVGCRHEKVGDRPRGELDRAGSARDGSQLLTHRGLVDGHVAGEGDDRDAVDTASDGREEPKCGGALAIGARENHEVRRRVDGELVVVTAGIRVGGKVCGHRVDEVEKICRAGAAHDRELGSLLWRELGELAIDAHEGGLGGGVFCYRLETSGVRSEYVAHRRSQDGGGERTTARSSEIVGSHP